MSESSKQRSAGDVAGFRLYGIEAAIADTIEKHVDPETGEIGEIPSADLDALGLERDELLAELAIAAKGELAVADALEEEGKRIAAAYFAGRDRAKRRAERFRAIVEARLPKSEKIKTGRVSIRWQKSVAVEVSDESKIPEDCFRHVAPDVDKVELRKRLERVEAIRGELELLEATAEGEDVQPGGRTPETVAALERVRAELAASAFEGAAIVARFSLVVR